MRLGLAVLAATILVACGGTKTDGNGNPLGGTPGQSSKCTVTLSGAQTGSFDCKPATTVWSSANNKGGFAFAHNASGAPTITVAIGFPGEPAAGEYTNTNQGADGGVTVQVGSGAGTQVWAATVGGASSQGSYDLHFSSVSGAFSTSDGKAYDGEGTLNATLQPLTGQSGSVTVQVTF